MRTAPAGVSVLEIERKKVSRLLGRKLQIGKVTLHAGAWPTHSATPSSRGSSFRLLTNRAGLLRSVHV